MTQSFTDFEIYHDVRLIGRHGDVASRTCGRILGKFPSSTGETWVVSFEGDRVRIAGDVLREQLVLTTT